MGGGGLMQLEGYGAVDPIMEACICNHLSTLKYLLARETNPHIGREGRGAVNHLLRRRNRPSGPEYPPPRFGGPDKASNRRLLDRRRGQEGS